MRERGPGMIVSKAWIMPGDESKTTAPFTHTLCACDCSLFQENARVKGIEGDCTAAHHTTVVHPHNHTTTRIVNERENHTQDREREAAARVSSKQTRIHVILANSGHPDAYTDIATSTTSVSPCIAQREEVGVGSRSRERERVGRV